MNTKCPMPYSGKIASVLLAATLSLFATSAAHAEIAFRAAASATDDAGTSLTINKPAGVVSGDLMLAGIADVGAATGITGPSGWTLVRTIEDVVRQTIWSKIAGSSEPSSYTWTLSATRRISGGIVAFSGVDASSPIQVENGAVEGNTVTTTHTTPTIATSGSSTWLVSLFADQRASGTWSTWTAPSGTTERVDVHTTNANAGNSSIEINTVGPVGAGNYSHTATASGGSKYAAMEIIALNAAAPAAPPAAPSDLGATAVSSSQIDLTWTDNATDETGFEIERKTGAGGTYAQIATPGANATSFQDTGLTAATTYFYRVRAVNGSGASAWSNEASAATTGGGGGEITFRAAASAKADAGTSLTISKPAGVVSGDLMLAGIADVGAATGITGPSGWTLVRTIEDVVRQTTWSKIAGSSEPSSYTWTLSATRRISGGIVAFGGVDASTPIQVENGAKEGNQVTTSHTTPTIATSGSSTWLVSLFADQRGAGTWSTWTPPSGTTERVDQQTTNANAGNSSIEINTVGPVGAGNYSHTATASGGSKYAGMEIIALNAVAPAAPPAAPGDLTATAVSSGQIDLAWTDNSSNETGFKIERKTGSGGTYSQIATVGTDVVSYSDTGLSAATTYFYRVRATNSAGDSAYSNEASATTADSVPAAPSDLSAVALNGSKIDLAWTDNSNNETGFKIERKTGAGGTYSQIATVGADVTNYNDTGLAAMTTYFYRVRATNATGDSAYSNEASATTSEQQNPFGGVAWAIPGKIEAEDYDEGGEGVAYHDTTAGNFDGEYRTDDVDIKVSTDTGGGYAIGLFAAAEWLEYTVNVGNAGAYDFKIRVGSKFASRTFHIEINGVDVTGPINVPQMPDWDQYQTVTISGIELNGGEQVMRVVMGSLDFMDLNWIEIVESGAPDAPMDLTATVVSSTQINLAWTDNSNNETGFKIERKTGAGGTYSQIATVGVDVLSYSDTGLIDSTTYFYRVRATNATGDSAYSNEASATTADSVPAAPSDLGTVAISESQIDLAWTDNSNNETGFKIERKTGAGGTYSQIATVGADVVSYSDTGLSAATTYFYRVRATNATGDSAFSNEASATTGGGGGAAPAAPSDLIATAASSSQINLTWADNATDETGFEIERKTGSGGTYAQIATPGANTTSFENTGLTAGTTYFYRIRAVNASGESAWSNEASATTQTSTVGPRTVSKPPGSVDVFPGNNIQNIVNANSAGTTFYIRAGVHRLQKITPRNGDTFVGELGAVLKGSKVLTNWNVSGSNYYVTGQTQGPGQIMGKTSTGFERGAYPEELFLDGNRLRHVGSISDLAAGRWFFDYANDRIYMRDNPTGRTVETSVTDYAFVDGASNVTIENLVIEQYATPGQRGTVGLNGVTSGWVVKFNAIGYNHGNGVKLAGTAAKLLNNYIYQQGMLGVSGGGTGQLVEGNEIAFNAAPEVRYGSGYAAGTKWARSTNLIVRGNHSHDNYYAGLWTDGNNFSTLYEDNLVENNGHNGLFYEVSYSHTIRNNTARGNGFRFHSWFNGAGIFINTSQNAEVYGNTVTNNRNGIMMVGFNRGAPLPGNDPYILKNINVHDNTVTMDKGRTGWYGSNSTPSTLSFNNNTYFLKGSTSYFNAGGGENNPPLTKSQWQAQGKDVNSTFTVF